MIQLWREDRIFGVCLKMVDQLVGMHYLIYFCDFKIKYNEQDKIIYIINNQEELNILTDWMNTDTDEIKP